MTYFDDSDLKVCVFDVKFFMIVSSMGLQIPTLP